MNKANTEASGSGALVQPQPILSAPQVEGWMLRFLRQQAVHWLWLLGVGEFLVLIGAAFLAIYLRYITAPSPLEAYV